MPPTTIDMADLIWLIETLEQRAATLSGDEATRLKRIAVKAGLAEETRPQTRQSRRTNQGNGRYGARWGDEKAQT